MLARKAGEMVRAALFRRAVHLYRAKRTRAFVVGETAGKRAIAGQAAEALPRGATPPR